MLPTDVTGQHVELFARRYLPKPRYSHSVHYEWARMTLNIKKPSFAMEVLLNIPVVCLSFLICRKGTFPLLLPPAPRFSVCTEEARVCQWGPAWSWRQQAVSRGGGEPSPPLQREGWEAPLSKVPLHSGTLRLCDCHQPGTERLGRRRNSSLSP